MTSRFAIRSRSSCRLILAALVVAVWSIAASSHGQDVVDLEEKAIRDAVARVAPSVVRIETIGGLEQVGDVLLGEGPTTGLVVSSDGYIISSTFNFLRQPTSILVALSGNKRVPAEVVARDRSRMLVLLKISAPESLPVPEMVPAAEMAVGQRAIAIGRALHPEQPNISSGILSAKHRIYGKAIQTDAKISPSNYGGPLIDLQGRVLGVLVPMSPDSDNELAGAEWYDGGIGFAVPLVDIQQHLDRLKKGENLHPGLIGLTLKPGDMYSLPAEIVATHPKSPAYQSGLRAGDKIIEINGKPIDRQVQLKHALGPLYAGDKIKLVTMRGTERREVSIELIEKLIPYQHPFLGVLPERLGAGEKKPATVRWLYPDSPAAKAGVEKGDRLLKLAGKPAEDATAFRQALASLEPGQKVAITYGRDGKEHDVEVELAALPETLIDPATLPSAKPTTADSDPAKADADPVKADDQKDKGGEGKDGKADEGKKSAEKEAAKSSDEKNAGQKKAAITKVEIPEEPNECVALVPAGYSPEVPHGLIVYLPPPGELKNDALLQRWQDLCESRQLIVVAPQAALPDRWTPIEVGFIRKTIDHMLSNYTIDSSRVAAYGYQSGGAMAYLTAFRHRDKVRAVIAADAPVSALSKPPDNDPIERLAFFVAISDQSRLKNRLTAGVKALRELKFPVVELKISGEPRDLNADELKQVAAWIDTLDRI